MSELMEKARILNQTTKSLQKQSTAAKNDALLLIADELRRNQDYILQENSLDIEGGKLANWSPSLFDRLLLTQERIQQIIEGLIQLVELNDPIGETIESWNRPNGLSIQSIRVPLGVVGMVYEARPNVTVDAAALCLKTGNCVLLRGSSSAIHTNRALVHIMKQALSKSKISPHAIELLEDTSHETAEELFRLNGYLDVLIPRGGASLIQNVIQKATVPVLETGVGNCHMFIDETASFHMACDIVLNAKMQRPSVCNSVETVLIHQNWPHTQPFIEFLHQHHIEIRGDEVLSSMFPYVKTATEWDWENEFLAPILAAKIVDDTNHAVSHIDQYGTMHSEAIISETQEHVDQFLQEVDAAVVYHNASTRFTDGEQFGFGAEIGISTQKLHARGPMGVKALTTTKSIVKGTGQIRES